MHRPFTGFSESRKVRVGVSLDPHESFDCFARMPKELCRRPGYEIELFHETMKYLGMDQAYEFVQQPIRDYGSRLPDGSWSGLVGMLANGTIDMTALTMRFTAERYDAVDYGFPINYYQQIYFIRQPQEFNYRNFIFMPFSTPVWITLLVAFVVAACVHSLIVGNLRLRHVSSCGDRMTRAVARSFWDFYAIGMRQNYEIYRYFSSVMLGKMWIVFCLIVSQYYQSTMHSLLVAPLRTTMPFTNVQELTNLLETNKWHLIYRQQNVIPSCARRDNGCKRLTAALAVNPLRVPVDIADALLDPLVNNVYFGADDRDFIQHQFSVWERHLPVLIIKDNLVDGFWVSYAFNKNQSTLRHRFNEALVNVLPGINSMKRRYRAPKWKFNNSLQFKKIQIRMEHIQQIFQLYIILISISVAAFIAEHVWYTWYDKTRRITPLHRRVVVLSKVNDYWRQSSRLKLAPLKRFASARRNLPDLGETSAVYNTPHDYRYFNYDPYYTYDLEEQC